MRIGDVHRRFLGMLHFQVAIAWFVVLPFGTLHGGAASTLQADPFREAGIVARFFVRHVVRWVARIDDMNW